MLALSLASVTRADHCSDAEPLGWIASSADPVRVPGYMAPERFRSVYELSSAEDGLLVVELGRTGFSGPLPDLSFYDEGCRRMRSAKVDSAGLSTVAFLPVRGGENVFILLEQGFAGTSGISYWLQGGLLRYGAGSAGRWAERERGGDCGGVFDRKVFGELARLALPDLDDPVDEAETEVMPSAGPTAGEAGGRWAVVFDRDLDDPVDEAETEVMPLAVDEPVLLRVSAGLSRGLVALGRGDGCAAAPWPAESVLVAPGRQLLAYLEPGRYHLRSLRPRGAGWSNPTVEVFPLREGREAATPGR